MFLTPLKAIVPYLREKVNIKIIDKLDLDKIAQDS